MNVDILFLIVLLSLFLVVSCCMFFQRSMYICMTEGEREREEREIDRGRKRERVTEELIIVHYLHNSFLVYQAPNASLFVHNNLNCNSFFLHKEKPGFDKTKFNDSGSPLSQSPHCWPLLRFPELFFPPWSLAFPVPVNLLSQSSVLMAYLEILAEVLESGRWSFSFFLPPQMLLVLGKKEVSSLLRYIKKQK